MQLFYSHVKYYQYSYPRSPASLQENAQQHVSAEVRKISMRVAHIVLLLVLLAATPAYSLNDERYSGVDTRTEQTDSSDVFDARVVREHRRRFINREAVFDPSWSYVNEAAAASSGGLALGLISVVCSLIFWTGRLVCNLCGSKYPRDRGYSKNVQRAIRICMFIFIFSYFQLHLCAWLLWLRLCQLRCNTTRCSSQTSTSSSPQYLEPS